MEKVFSSHNKRIGREGQQEEINIVSKWMPLKKLIDTSKSSPETEKGNTANFIQMSLQ
jgi:hypothetical protein